MQFLVKIWGWFQGKKTILGGLVILAGAVVGVWYGKLDPVSGLTIAGFGFSIIGWADKANRHQAELLTAFQDVARLGAEVRSGNFQVAMNDAETSAGTWIKQNAGAIRAALNEASNDSTGAAAK